MTIQSINAQPIMRGNYSTVLWVPTSVNQDLKIVCKRAVTNKDRANKACTDWRGCIGSVVSLLVHDKLQDRYFSTSR